MGMSDKKASQAGRTALAKALGQACASMSRALWLEPGDPGRKGGK